MPSRPNSIQTSLSTQRKSAEKAEQELIRQLEKAGVTCKWIGNLVYQGIYEMVFMSSNDVGFKNAFQAWLKKAGPYRSEALSTTGWEYFDAYLVPNALTRQEMRDAEIIDQLTRGGTNLEVGHWTNHTIKGPDDLLAQLAEEMFTEEFYIFKKETGSLILEKCLKMVPADVSSALQSLRARCQQLALDYQGWETPIVKDTVLSGSIKNGFGSYVWGSNGLRYDGEWVNGKRTGKGHMRYQNGTQYIGDFIGDDRTGEATMIYAHDEKFSGAFMKGELHGEGTYWWPSGNVFHGDWYYGNKHGKGTFWWASGDIYTGDFVQDDRTGKGMYFWKMGDWYEGEFLKGKCHGFGREYLHDKLELREGNYLEGSWKGGRTIEQGKNLWKRPPMHPDASEPVTPPPAPAETQDAGNSPGNAAPPPSAPASSPPPASTPTSSYSGSINLEKRKPIKVDISWVMLESSDGDLLDAIGREARTASARAKKCILFLSGGSSGPGFNLKQRILDYGVAELFASVHIIEVGGAQSAALTAGGFPNSQAPTLFKLYPNGRFGEAYWDAIDQVDGAFEFETKVKELLTA